MREDGGRQRGREMAKPGRVVRPGCKSGSSEGETKRKLSGNSLICSAA